LSSEIADYIECYFKIGETMGRQTRKNLLTNNTAALWQNKGLIAWMLV
jgi:hypothetical protein